MALLIDAYNLIHADPRLRDLLQQRGQRAACAEVIGLFARWRAARPELPDVVLVFDGAPPARPDERIPGLLVRYADRDADGDLALLLERKGDHVLVSGDGELRDRAAVLRQRAVDPRALLDELRVDLEAAAEVRARDPGRLDRGEVDAWLARFGGKPAGAPPAAPPPEASGGLSPDEVQRWLDYFGEGERG